MLGAILTQNTNWRNVESAINNLKKKNLLKPAQLNRISIGELKSLIRPAGFYNIKSDRVKIFVKYLCEQYKGDIGRVKKRETVSLRNEILGIKGIGPETCDSILLYALEKPVFVVDAYTKRVFSRHNIVDEDATYDEIQSVFEKNLNRDVKLFNEYHALIVQLAKDKCKNRKPVCETCPLFCIEE